MILDEQKFEVIVHVTNENLFSELAASLERVVVPQNFSAEVQPVTGDEKYFAYETARLASDAKYKIYLDERARITNENFLTELLKIFSDKRVGMVGASGAIELSTHGISLTSSKRTDENFSGEVEILDGFFIATQYDLPWRYDLFTDNFFGAQAQCVEFKRAGYKIFVPRQNPPWISVRGENFQLEETARQKFLDEYSKDLFPLVSVIIPTFNRPKYFSEALDSAFNQTYRNIEIFISDNSTNDDTEKIVRGRTDARIQYFHHKNFNADDNWNFARAYNNPAAEYVNWLLDDDKFYPTKIEKMIEVYRNNPDVSLVTSVRDFIDATGTKIGDSREKLKGDVKIFGEQARRFLFVAGNYVGEPTAVLIRKKFLRDNDLCLNADETGFFSLVDVSTWLQLLHKGNLFHLDECLSAFRQHEQQANNWESTRAIAPIDYAKLLKQAYDENLFLHAENDFLVSVMNLILEISAKLSNYYFNDVFHSKEAESLKKTLVDLANSIS